MTERVTTRSENRGSENPPQVGVLINHPIQYFAPALRLLAARDDLHPRVYYWDAATDGVVCSDFGRKIRWDIDLHSGYDWWSPPAELPAWRRCLALARRLRRDRPQALLCFGWGSPAARVGILCAAVTRTPLLYYGDSHPNYSATGRYDRIRRVVLRFLFRSAAGAVSTGSSNRQFYINHGLAEERIHPGVLPADVDSFAIAADRRTSSGEGSTPNRPLVIAFAGKFIAIKAIDVLIEAASRLTVDEPWEVWLIGDGPLRHDLESLVEQRSLSARVRFLGFRNASELPPLLSAADVLVLPSWKDHRGLVAVEAMAAGAVAVVSSATGLWEAGDVIQHEETGLVFPAGDVDGLAACLQRLMDDPGLRARLATGGRARARSLGPREFAATAAAALVATAEWR
jgi:glycosyltransferase involved in cell wall biosynthesis